MHLVEKFFICTWVGGQLYHVSCTQGSLARDVEEAVGCSSEARVLQKNILVVFVPDFWAGV